MITGREKYRFQKRRKRKRINEAFSLSLELMHGELNIKQPIELFDFNNNKNCLREWITPAVATAILDKLVHGLNNSGNLTNC